VPPPPDRPAATGRSVAAALLGLGGAALRWGLRAVPEHGARQPAAQADRATDVDEASPDDAAKQRSPAADGETAAARIDAARERLRARIAAPADDDPPPRDEARSSSPPQREEGP
jgi:hypothetical protein